MDWTKVLTLADRFVSAFERYVATFEKQTALGQQAIDGHRKFLEEMDRETSQPPKQ